MEKSQSEKTTINFSKIDAQQIKDAASSAADAATKFIRKHPLESVGGALLVGIVVGLLINRK